MPEAVVEKKSAAVVVTSENREQFMLDKINAGKPAPETPKAEAKEAPKAEEKKPEAKAGEEAKEGEPKEEKKKQHGINERFSELTQAKKDAEAKAAREQAAREAAERRAAEAEAKLAPAKPAADADEPQRGQFADDGEYLKALAHHSAEKIIEERDQKAAKAKEEAAQTERLATWRARVEATQKEVPDYQERIAASTAVVSDQVRDAIIESEAGPRILLHLADNPQEAAAIAKLTIGGALKAIGRLEAKLEAPAKSGTVTPEAKAAPKVEISQAPAPISPLKGNGAALEEPINSKGEFVGTYAQWKEGRKTGKIK